MIYLLFILSLVTGLIFSIPQTLHRSLQQGLVFFCFFISFIYFRESRKKITGTRPHFRFRFLALTQNKKIYITLISLGLLLFFISFSFHAYQISHGFSNAFLFHDADYIGMDEVIRNMWRGDGFKSSYYSLDGKESYLLHHFSPALILYVPFGILTPDRWGYALGSFFFYFLGLILWLLLFLKATKKTEASSSESSVNNLPIAAVLIIALMNQLYLYRLGTSYHFEVLVLPLSAVFFYFYEKAIPPNAAFKNKLMLYIALFLFLSIKEDIAVYLCLFLFAELISFFVMEIYRFRLNLNFIKLTLARLPFRVMIFSSLYYLFAVFIFPEFFSGGEKATWWDALSKEYSPAYKKVDDFERTIKTFFELGLSGGFGILLNFPATLGLGLIYLTHAQSTRPWHHEIYGYYCYTIIPFLLYSGIIWIRKGKPIPIWVAFMIFGLLFAKNGLDSNFPLHFKQQTSEIDIIKQEKVKDELTRVVGIIPNHSIVFCQYNLSFFISENQTLYPLSRLDRRDEICSNINCYVVLAPGFTTEILVPKQNILNQKERIKNSSHHIYLGEYVEVLKLD